MELQKSSAGICSNSCSAGIKCYFCIMSVASGRMTAEPAFFFLCMSAHAWWKKERMGGRELTSPEEAFLKKSYDFRKNSN